MWCTLVLCADMSVCVVCVCVVCVCVCVCVCVECGVCVCVCVCGLWADGAHHACSNTVSSLRFGLVLSCACVYLCLCVYVCVQKAQTQAQLLCKGATFQFHLFILHLCKNC